MKFWVIWNGKFKCKLLLCISEWTASSCRSSYNWGCWSADIAVIAISVGTPSRLDWLGIYAIYICCGIYAIAIVELHPWNTQNRASLTRVIYLCLPQGIPLFLRDRKYDRFASRKGKSEQQKHPDGVRHWNIPPGCYLNMYGIRNCILIVTPRGSSQYVWGKDITGCKGYPRRSVGIEAELHIPQTFRMWRLLWKLYENCYFGMNILENLQN